MSSQDVNDHGLWATADAIPQHAMLNSTAWQQTRTRNGQFTGKQEIMVSCTCRGVNVKLRPVLIRFTYPLLESNKAHVDLLSHKIALSSRLSVLPVMS